MSEIEKDAPTSVGDPMSQACLPIDNPIYGRENIASQESPKGSQEIPKVPDPNCQPTQGGGNGKPAAASQPDEDGGPDIDWSCTADPEYEPVEFSPPCPLRVPPPEAQPPEAADGERPAATGIEQQARYLLADQNDLADRNKLADQHEWAKAKEQDGSGPSAAAHGVAAAGQSGACPPPLDATTEQALEHIDDFRRQALQQEDPLRKVVALQTAGLMALAQRAEATLVHALDQSPGSLSQLAKVTPGVELTLRVHKQIDRYVQFVEKLGRPRAQSSGSDGKTLSSRHLSESEKNAN